MKRFLLIILIAIIWVGAFFGGYFWHQRSQKELTNTSNQDQNQTQSASPQPELPLLKYSIPNLAKIKPKPGEIQFERVVADEEKYLSLIFTYQTEGKTMSGLANLPKEATQGSVLMLRGYMPLAGYESGGGTKNAGLYFAQRGFQTFAPDFLGYGDSDQPPADDWQGRFEKPLQVMQLLSNLENSQFVCNEANLLAIPSKNGNPGALETAFISFCDNLNLTVAPDKLGIWAHSNGGQISLSTLETTGQNYPATLWAPVSVGFPYSVLFFTDEAEDEGKDMRAYINLLERDYDVFDFSHTQHLDQLAPKLTLQLHHGTADEAALISWSDEFLTKIEAENENREEEKKIDLTYHRYPGADHNLRPSWDTVVARDVEFFAQAFATTDVVE